MKDYSLAFSLLLFIHIALLSSCETTPEIDPIEPIAPVVEQETEQEETVAEEPAQEEPVEEQDVEEEVAEEAAEEEEQEETPEEEATTVEVVEAPVEEEEFQVSEEVFTETFEDIRVIIEELNSIIRDENYDRWLQYLAREYIDHFSSPEILKENSEQPLLKKYKINLATLRDYFKNVVVPSRSNARLDDLVFIDNEHLKAIMIINDQRTILYQLTRIDGVWKIGL